MRHAAPRLSSRFIAILISATIFFIIGTGNLLLGNYKYQEYLDLLSKARAELASPEQHVSIPLLGPSINLDKQVQHINRLDGRVDFYNLVRLGGKCMLALSGIILLLCLVNAQQAKGKPHS